MAKWISSAISFSLQLIPMSLTLVFLCSKCCAAQSVHQAIEADRLQLINAAAPSRSCYLGQQDQLIERKRGM